MSDNSRENSRINMQHLKVVNMPYYGALFTIDNFGS